MPANGDEILCETKAQVSASPNKDAAGETPKSGQEPKQSDPAQQVNDPPEPPIGKVRITHRIGSARATVLFTVPAWMWGWDALIHVIVASSLYLLENMPVGGEPYQDNTRRSLSSTRIASKHSMISLLRFPSQAQYKRCPRPPTVVLDTCFIAGSGSPSWTHLKTPSDAPSTPQAGTQGRRLMSRSEVPNIAPSSALNASAMRVERSYTTKY
ncbi:hypothetical protein V8E55_009933 [Tylopilus felleus]